VQPPVETAPVPPIVAAFVAALAAGDAAGAGACLAPDFGLHEGMGRDGWLDHELGEFSRRWAACGFAPGDALGIAPSAAPAGLRGFLVLDAAGGFVYEDALCVGPDGLIRGNGRGVEVVSKLQFERGRPTRRAVAIRSHGRDIAAVTPLDAAEDVVFEKAATWDEDRFHSFSFTVPGDDLRSRVARMRVTTRAGGETVSVLLRGADHPLFLGARWPELDGNRVAVDIGRGRLWGLAVGFEGGGTASVPHPSRPILEFDRPVEWATLTDALDNDWTTRRADGGRSR
jgi:hypothetical protein